MSIHCDALYLSIAVAEHNVSCLPRHTWEPDQIVHGIRPLAVEFLNNHLRCTYYVPCLVPVKARGPYLLLKCLDIGVCIILGGLVFLEELFRDFVHPFICALGGEYCGHEQRHGLSKLKGGLDL